MLLTPILVVVAFFAAYLLIRLVLPPHLAHLLDRITPGDWLAVGLVSVAVVVLVMM